MCFWEGSNRVPKYVFFFSWVNNIHRKALAASKIPTRIGKLRSKKGENVRKTIF